ncbi:hypothetical protein H5410_047377 [Solanum commersonii]|uniref:At2g24240-like C-terminal beta-propeller domain-containing protein n=1 Tax=Solanum commersonii TaxID=4109 RepID=A0A9J5XH45_SOLCO|nr:hypothetical protein H5410_047377 [Solanum commersonii]
MPNSESWASEGLFWTMILRFDDEQESESAKWGLFDGNRARLAQSIGGWSAWDGQYPHANPSGWCCVDWMLEEHPIEHMNDVCWVDSESIVVSSDKNLALFNASTGELRYKFQVTDKSSSLAPSATASTLEFGSDYKLFSSCNTAGDLVTENSVVWSLVMNYDKHCSNVICDALSIEESGSICVLGSNECTDESVNWRSKDSHCIVVPTSKLRVDPIRDFSIGGNPLFALHYQENVIHVPVSNCGTVSPVWKLTVSRSSEYSGAGANRMVLGQSRTDLGHNPVRSAKWGLFDGNRARLAQSIGGWSAWDGQYPHANPSGWCCVDWMLEEHPIEHMNDVVGSDKNLADGGIELFNASTGELRYKFQVTDKSSGLAPSATASTLEFGSDYKLFSSCNTAGDLVTENSVVWSLVMNYDKHCSNVICDALSIEESGSICVLGSNECTDESVNWRSKDSHCIVVPTSKLRVDPIRDFSIGGNPLFALHYQENVIHVWETPHPPII